MKYAATRGWQEASLSAAASCAACPPGETVREDVSRPAYRARRVRATVVWNPFSRYQIGVAGCGVP